MKTFNCLLLSLLLLSSSCTVTFAQSNHSDTTTYFLHTIGKGQSIYSIASMYNVSIEAIIKLNPGCDEKIYTGQALKIPQGKERKETQQFHTIQPGETLYRLTQKYNLSAKAICEANPGLSAENFKIGQVICIPATEEVISHQNPVAPVQQESIQPTVKSRCKEMHRVTKKETIFSVSRAYGITERELLTANPELKDGMKKGSFLCIPYPTERKQEKATTPVTPPSDGELFSTSKPNSRKYATVKAAIILPFLVDGSSREESSKRMVEYYEGFLLAVDSLKRTGVSVDLYTYDSGDERSSIKSILAKEEMKKMNIIFGPQYQEHIKPLADFAKKYDIPLVIPFTSKDNEVFKNPSVFQINTPQSYLYSEVYEHFLRKFTNANVVILETADVDKDKQEFIKGLKQELKNKEIPYTVLKADATPAMLKQALRDGKENIFIPTSGSNIALIKLLPQLIVTVRENPTQTVHLFGYPEWQTYTADHLASFYELDTYFYTSFYTNNLLPEAINFTSAYRKWYSKEMGYTYPKYGMLGYDTAFYFLKALSTYGSDFENQLANMNVTPIQTGFNFARVNNWGGFINKKVFFVRFSKDFELIKLDFE